MTTTYLVQHGEKENLPGDPGLTQVGRRQAPSPVAAVTHSGVTIDLLRDLLGDDELPPHLLTAGVPPGAITAVENLHVVMIASTSHLS